MPDSCAALKETHQPQVLVETVGLSEKEWLAYRRKGIGGSDVAALLGISPWRTARDLYYDKLNIAAVEDNENNWVALEMGHLLEPLVAKIFQHRTGYKIYQVKKMFQHPKYPWMLADVDYFVELPDGTTAILEIKTTNYNAKDHWWLDGEETVPVYYETQGRHYMAVMDVDRCFFCCLYGNNEEETIIREIRRDEAYEDEMIFLEQHFWENHVLAKTPPPYTEDGDLVIESVRRHTGPADKDAPVVTFDYSLTAKLMRYLQLQEEKKRAEKDSKEIDADMQRLKGALIAEMGKSCKAICQQDGVNYTVTYNPVRKPIREVVNPFRSAEDEIKIGVKVFRVNDRIMQTKNTAKVSNGDLGFIRYIKDGENGKRVGLDFGVGRELEYSVEDMVNLDLAYATTIHKSMGSEYETVIMPLLKAHSIMLYRNLLYTGITRAKKRVVLIGQKQVLFMAIHRNEISKRNTLLGARIDMYFKAYARRAGIPLPNEAKKELKHAG